MIESVKHTMPYRINNPATVKLRTIKLLKPYNLESEQSLVEMNPQTSKWVSVSYEDIVFDQAIKDAKEKYYPQFRDPYIGDINKEIKTRPTDEEFVAYLPPSKEDVLISKEILNTYQAQLKYKIYFKIDSPMGDIIASNSYIDDLTYQAGIKATAM